MKLPLKYYDYLGLNEDESENAPRYITREGLSKDIIADLKQLNESSKFYTGKDLIAFS